MFASCFTILINQHFNNVNNAKGSKSSNLGSKIPKSKTLYKIHVHAGSAYLKSSITKYFKVDGACVLLFCNHIFIVFSITFDLDILF